MKDQGGNWVKAKGNHWGIVRLGRGFSQWSGGEAGLSQQQPKSNLGDYWTPEHLDKMVLMVVKRWRLDCVSSDQRKPMKLRKADKQKPMKLSKADKL